MTPVLCCGCQSIEDLRSWFPSNNYSALLFFGFNAYEIDVDKKDVKVCSTTKQVVFRRNKSATENNINLY